MKRRYDIAANEVVLVPLFVNFEHASLLPYSSVSIVDFKQVVVCWAVCIFPDTLWYNLTSSNFKLSCYSYIRFYSIVF